MICSISVMWEWLGLNICRFWLMMICFVCILMSWLLVLIMGGGRFVVSLMEINIEGWFCVRLI